MTEETPMWERVADALYFIENPAAVAQIADRFEGEYAKAYALAKDEASRQRALEAMRHYLHTGATPRKPWSLSKEDAERAYEALRALL